MSVTLIPLLGAWHLRYPVYNVASVLALVRASRPEVVVPAPLVPGALATPAWQDTPEIALPPVLAWAERQGVRLESGMPESPDPGAEADFQRYLAGYPRTREQLVRLEALLRPLDELLPQPLTLARIWDEVVPVLKDYQQEREAVFGDGPGTDWWRERLTELATSIAKTCIAELPETRVTVLASAEQLPFLRAALLELGTEVLTPREVPHDETIRERALLDVAFRGDAADPVALLSSLREVKGAEARFHEANLLLMNGHPAEALERLEAAVNGDFSTPYYLPGYLLARLGQLRDLNGDRAGAVRTYRGVLAFDWVPEDAREAAVTGLEAPFEGIPE